MTTPFDAPDWRGMSQQDRDLGLNNGAAVAGSAGIVAGWDRHSGEAPPALPDEVIAATRSRYVEAYELLTGLRFADWG